MQKKTEGSSLVELLVVFCIVVVLMSMTVSQAPIVKRYAVRAEMEKMRAAFWYLAQRALSENKSFAIYFDTKQNNYVVDDQKHSLPRGITFGAPSWVKGPPSDPKLPITSGITFKEQKVFFNSDGTISSGAVYVQQDKGECLYALTLPVGHISYTRIYRYQDGWKLIE
jgi:type II secretory pathway pseudopilin PulG